MMNIRLRAVTLVAVFSAGGVTDAATMQERLSLQSAVNNCQAAMPEFESALRKRPLGIANESESSAFVSCSLSTEILSSTGISEVLAIFINRGPAATTVSCILTNGRRTDARAPTSFPKTTQIVASTSGSIRWSTADNFGAKFVLTNLSCNLPPHVEINSTTMRYDTDVGQ